MARRDPRIEALLDRFVCVRLVQANALDLAQFQFDFDLTFAVFFLNADGTVYGRYGTRSDRPAVRDISLEGFRKALEGALALHAAYPGNRQALEGKRALVTTHPRPERYPSLQRYQPRLDYDGAVAKSCMHCHQVGAAERQLRRAAGRPVPDDVLFPWPMPDVVGLRLDPAERAVVREVVAGSAAARAGFRSGDEIVSLASQPLLSIADVQWVLHRAPGAAELPAVVRRPGGETQLALALEDGWRRKSDISWRTTTWDLRRMAFGGLVLEAEEGAKTMRLRVKHVGQWGQHAVAKRAGVRKGDVLVSYAGRSDPLTETELLAWALAQHAAGARVEIVVERGGERVPLAIRTQ